MRGLNYFSTELRINDTCTPGFMLTFNECPASIYSLSVNLKIDKEKLRDICIACGAEIYYHNSFYYDSLCFKKERDVESVIVALKLIRR
jgi:hypothetical protein